MFMVKRARFCPENVYFNHRNPSGIPNLIHKPAYARTRDRSVPHLFGNIQFIQNFLRSIAIAMCFTARTSQIKISPRKPAPEARACNIALFPSLLAWSGQRTEPSRGGTWKKIHELSPTTTQSEAA